MVVFSAYRTDRLAFRRVKNQLAHSGALACQDYVLSYRVSTYGNRLA